MGECQALVITGKFSYLRICNYYVVTAVISLNVTTVLINTHRKGGPEGAYPDGGVGCVRNALSTVHAWLLPDAGLKAVGAPQEQMCCRRHGMPCWREGRRKRVQKRG